MLASGIGQHPILLSRIGHPIDQIAYRDWIVLD
jgi:hypothetical protein